MIADEKTCARCEQTKPADAFTRHAGAADGLRSECKPCRAKSVAERRAQQPERHVLVLMIQRCHNEKHPKFNYYGGRGIRVSDEWRGDGGFDRFLAHIGPRPSAKHSIDRIDCDGNYEPGNVRWATQGEQMLNTRKTVRLTVRGVTRTLREWSDETRIPLRTLEWRRDEGWSPERIVDTPVAANGKHARAA